MSGVDSHAQPTVDDSIYWGFGCFQFGLRQSPPENWTVGDYVNELTRTLRGISAVDHVEVFGDQEYYGSEVSWPGRILDLGSGDEPYPQLPNGELRVQLVIPAGVQTDLCTLSGGELPNLFTERFELRVFYEFHMPVTVIRVVDPYSEPSGSLAVNVVWHLLQREFARLTDTKINFQLLGPSPMHADFKLVPAVGKDRADTEWTFDLEKVRRRGYDSYEFAYNDALFPDPLRAFDALYREISSEVDLFYFENSFQARRLRDWAELRDHADELIDLQGQPGIEGWASRTLRAGRAIREVAVELARYESAVAMSEQAVASGYGGTYSADVTPYLQEMVDNERKNAWNYPTQDIHDLLVLFEGRRLGGVEAQALLASALAGGTVAAAVSLLISR